MEPIPGRVIPKRRTKPKPKRTWLKVLIAFALLAVAGDVALLAMEVGLPTVQDVRGQKWPEATWVVTGNGHVLGELYQERRRTVSAGDLPMVVRSAFIAAHDPTFGTRGPLTITELISAFLRSGRRADGHPGGLSVPLAYGALPKPKGTYDRMRAWLLARRLENGLTRDDLIALYLNRVDLGEGIHGVEEGALNFFSRRASELSPTQAAVLASIAPRPTAYSPRGPEAIVAERRNLVLDRMVKLDAISSIDLEKEKAQPLGLQIFHPDPGAVLQTVRNRLRVKLGRDKVASGGLTVNIAEDLHVQAALEASLQDAAMRADELSGWRGPLSSLDSAAYGSIRDRALAKGSGIVDLSQALPLLAGSDAAAVGAAVRVLPAVPGQVAVGRVVEVSADSMKVDLGGAMAVVSASDAAWATASLPPPPAPEKKGKHAAPPPSGGLDRLVHPGDLVWVRLLKGPQGDGKTFSAHLTQRGGFDAAGLVVEDDTGRILGMVGGSTPESGHFDRVRNLVRPVGAELTPITFSLDLDKGTATAATLEERPAGVSPSLWDGDTDSEDEARARKKITLFEAFASHDVGGAAAVITQVGPSAALGTVQQLGFRKTNAAWLLKGPLGSPLSVANAWTVLANGGTAEAPHVIDEVLDSDAKRIWAPVDNSSALLKQGTVDLMRHWVVAANDTHRELIASHVGLDSWCAGRMGKVIAVVWVGPNRIIPGLHAPGPGPVLGAFADATANQARVDMGESVVMVSIDPDIGLVSQDPDGIMMPFLPNTAPKAIAPHHAPRPKHAAKKKRGR